MMLFKNEDHVVFDDGKTLEEYWNPGYVTPDVWVVLTVMMYLCFLSSSSSSS
jgi:hypothetical protein